MIQMFVRKPSWWWDWSWTYSLRPPTVVHSLCTRMVHGVAPFTTDTQLILLRYAEANQATLL
jgi:hypothetical protein